VNGDTTWLDKLTEPVISYCWSDVRCQSTTVCKGRLSFALYAFCVTRCWGLLVVEGYSVLDVTRSWSSFVVGRFLHRLRRLVKHTQFCVSFSALWSQNGNFQTPLSC